MCIASVSASRLLRNYSKKLPEKNLFGWNIMINGHVEHSNYEEALLLFRECNLRGLKRIR